MGFVNGLKVEPAMEKFCLNTVSRRVVINPKSDSSKSCFHVLYPKANTPTMKTPKLKLLELVTSGFSTGL
jgi:hypothetical protein